MPDSSRLTVALLSALQADAALMALMPDGVWFAEAPQGATRFVIVSLIESSDAQIFGRRAYESARYGVEARALSSSGGNAHAAFARFDTLLDPQPPLPPADLVIVGYGVMAIYREAYAETVEVDDVEPALRWSRCGGQYRIFVCPQPST